jgi:hypothetical protein
MAVRLTLLCALSTADAQTCAVYKAAYSYESLLSGLFTLQEACRVNIQSLVKQPFGPPTAFQVMNMMCKGPCRKLADHVRRLDAVGKDTGCVCKEAETRCPLQRVDMLCYTTGLCYEEEWYEDKVCASDACGRFITNEAAYRAQRAACSLSLDGAASAALGACAAIAAAGAVLAVAHGPTT